MPILVLIRAVILTEISTEFRQVHQKRTWLKRSGWLKPITDGPSTWGFGTEPAVSTISGINDCSNIMAIESTLIEMLASRIVSGMLA